MFCRRFSRVFSSGCLVYLACDIACGVDGGGAVVLTWRAVVQLWCAGVVFYGFLLRLSPPAQ